MLLVCWSNLGHILVDVYNLACAVNSDIYLTEIAQFSEYYLKVGHGNSLKSIIIYRLNHSIYIDATGLQSDILIAS
jgi:hypothetical protein